MECQTIKIPSKYLKENVRIRKTDLFKLKNINFSIEIEFSKAGSNLFSINFIAEPKDLLPFEASIEGKLISCHFENNHINKQVYFEKYANSDKLFFPKKLEEIRNIISGNDCLEISIGVRLPENPTNINNKNTPNFEETCIFSNPTQQKYSNTSSPSDKKNQITKLTNSQLSSSSTLNDGKKLFNKKSSDTESNDDDADANKPNIRRSSLDIDIDNNKYNGLYNQGATCYINSAIQSLFHLPLFRKTIYDIPTQNEEDPTHSIPLNLQCLFYNMQCRKSNCSTKMLTTSFGWEKNEVFRQQDIEEFLKKLISSLDDILKKIPDMKDGISSLFEGKTIQIIKDYSGKILSQNEEIFYDLSVEVKKTLEDSLKKFAKEEMITDYDDSKSLYPRTITYQTLLLILPPILQIQIKRYKYNTITGSAEKIDNEMSYKEEIDLSPFMHKKKPNQCTKYKLFGVIVHSGWVSGGHYYIYCKPEMKDVWYVFNDSDVQTADSKEALDDNFGGYDKYGYNYSSLSWKKDYSAYMLIYIRIDAIKNVFKPINADQIPQNIKDYAESVNQIELQSRKSDPACQIIFTIYTEKCVLENCKLGIASFANSKYCLKVITDMRLEAAELYQDVARIMNIDANCLRLWKINKDGQSFAKVIEPNDKLNILKAQNIFAQTKDANDNLVPKKNERTYFLILYTPLRVKPFVFIEMPSFSLKKNIYSLYDLKYNDIIDHAVKILKTNLTAKIRNDDVYIYLNKSGNVEKKRRTESCDEHNGTMIFLQVNDPDEVLDDTNIKNLEKKLNIKAKFKNINQNNQNDADTQDTTHKYFDFMTNELPKTVDKFFELKNCTMKAQVYSHSNILNSIGSIEFPALKPSELEQFINLAFDLNVNYKMDSLLLFNREENLNVPEQKPFNTKYSSTINDVHNSIYFYISSKKIAEDYSAIIRIIQLSKDGYTVSKVVLYYIPERDIHPFHQFKILNEDFFGNAKTRMFIVDENNNFGPLIKDEYQENLLNIDNKKKLRIEIIPDDQIDKELMLVYKGFVGDYSRIYPIEDPFYFAYIENESVSSFKSRISTFLQINNHFKVHKKSSTYLNDYVIKDKIHLLDSDRTLFILFDIDTNMS